MEARRFPDEHDARLWIADAKYHLDAAHLGELATLASVQRLIEFEERHEGAVERYKVSRILGVLSFLVNEREQERMGSSQWVIGEIMQFMKRLVFGLLGFMISVGMTWAGEREYQLIVGKDRKLCVRILEAFREDVDDRWRLRYQHEMFRQIAWKPVELMGHGPKTRHCSSLDKAIFDVDNDGRLDLVIKTTFCMKGSPSDSLYVFPADSPVLEQANWQDLSPLLATSNKFERTGGIYSLVQLPMEKGVVNRPALTGVFTVHPFMLGGSAYISLTDERGEWTAIAQYRTGGRFEDHCYLRAATE
jgi:hypothetical protein